MVLLTKAKAAVLVGAWAFATRVNAQGYYFQNQSDSCSGLGFQYLGCFTAPNSVDPFQFTPGVPTTRGGSNDPSQSYILFDNNDHTNATTDPNYCSLFCRAHGYKYTGLYNQGCTCGSSLGDSRKNLTIATEASCDIPCSGDPTENCGRPQGLRIFVDTSFQKEETLKAAPVSDLVNGYQKLGCFYGPQGGPTIPGPDFFRPTYTTPGQCFAFCADLKLPYARVIRDNANTFRCFCGADFGYGVRAYDDSSDQLCQNKCSDGIYANPALMGCLAPRIPGFYPITASTVPAGSYSCLPTPAFVNTRSKYSVNYSGSPSLTKTVSFVATATASGGAAFVPYGCYGVGSSILATPTTAPSTAFPSGSVTVNSCVTYCNGRGYSWAALRSPANQDSICICGNDISSTIPNGQPENFSTCNKRCSGDSSQFCGNNNAGEGGLVYVNTAVSTYTSGTWYIGQYNTWTLTPTYGCTGGVAATVTGPTAGTATGNGETTVTIVPSTVTGATAGTSSGTGGVTVTVVPSTVTGPTAGTSSGSSGVVVTVTSAAGSTTSDPAVLTDSSTTSSGSTTSDSSTVSDTASISTVDTASVTSSDTASITTSDTSSISTIDTASVTSSDTASITTSSTSSGSGNSTESISASNTDANSASVTASVSGNSTESNSASSTSSNTANNTAIDTGSNTAGNTDTNSATSTDSNSASATGSDIATNTVSNTASNTGSDTVINTDSNTATGTDSNTATNTESNSASSTDGSGAINTGSTDINASITGSSTDSATSSNTADASINTSSSIQGSDTNTAGPSATISGADTIIASQSTSAQGTESSSGSEPTTTPSTETGPGNPVTASQSTDTSTGGEGSASGSATGTVSSTASTTEVSGRPKVTVTSRIVRSFAAVFNTEQVPDKTGSYVNLTTYDPATKVAQNKSYVVQYLGCYLFDGITTPFVANDSRNFIGDEIASGTASGCAGVCAGANYILSANNQGDCFCGNELKPTPQLELEPDRSNCSASCPASELERCGGGDRLTSPSGALLSVPANSFFNIIEAVDGNSPDIIDLSGSNTTTTGAASDSATGSATNTGTGSSPASTGPGGNSNTVSATTTNGSTGTGTSASSTASSTNGVPGVQDMPGQTIIAGILNDGGAAQAQGTGDNGGSSVGAGFRVPTGGFLGGEDSPNPGSCSNAVPLNLTSGQLSSGGEFIAADTTDAYIALTASIMTAAITTTFSSVDGILHWFNPAFYQGEAGFCQVSSGQIYATFVPQSQWPQGCVAISLALYRVEQCQNGTLVDPSLATGTMTTTPVPTTTDGSGSNGGNGSGLATMTSPIPFADDIFPLDASPTDETCVSTVLSWEQTPEPTFINA
ncbi:hypothetical protein E8E14_004106 [Neopestalotiopsis sp. 37M]|nr:hypothetical protein E8E14_004106 [Neopestalotiopsis sp. 37M]